jgi:4-hydroxybutyryl-CoA dehydratase / vinylacetyl-CoA-Delta-isomerase
VNAPTVGDFEHPDLHAALGEAFEAPGFTAEDRLRLFHYVRDTTADAYGGWAFVTGQLAGGGQHAQRIVTMRQYNMEHAKKIARRAVGIGEFRKKGEENWKPL